MTPTNPYFASLPWYDFETTANQFDRLWSRVRSQLATEYNGIDSSLNRQTSLREQWDSPGLVLSQCCGPDLAAPHGRALRVIGRPILEGLDCEPGSYFSYVVARETDLSSSAKVAINSRTSWSGCLSLNEWMRDRCISASETLITGSHEASVEAISRGKADIAAIDAFSFRFLDTSAITTIGQTKTAPSPPFVSHQANPIPIDKLREVLGEAIASEADGLFEGLINCDRDDYQNYKFETALI